MDFYQNGKLITPENRLIPGEPINTDFGTWVKYEFEGEDGGECEIEAYSYLDNYRFYDIYNEMCEEFKAKGWDEEDFPDVDAWEAWGESQEIQACEEVWADKLVILNLIDRFNDIDFPLECVDFSVLTNGNVIKTEEDLDEIFPDAWDNLRKAVRKYLLPFFVERHSYECEDTLNAEALNKAVEWAKTNELPRLIGDSDAIKEAEIIRMDGITNLMRAWDYAIHRFLPGGRGRLHWDINSTPKYLRFLLWVTQITDASWWIKNKQTLYYKYEDDAFFNLYRCYKDKCNYTYKGEHSEE